MKPSTPSGKIPAVVVMATVEEPAPGEISKDKREEYADGFERRRVSGDVLTISDEEITLPTPPAAVTNRIRPTVLRFHW
ncbi:MAG: hypothetical protein ACLSDO_01455 [Anaerotruncus colihominis]